MIRKSASVIRQGWMGAFKRSTSSSKEGKDLNLKLYYDKGSSSQKNKLNS